MDIICYVVDFIPFRNFVCEHFEEYDGFHDEIVDFHYVASFSVNGLMIEIYGENKPTHLLNAYLHMLIENRLLVLLGDSFRQRVIRLKLEGYKTEPAFGYLLGFADAYQYLLHLANLPDDELKCFVDDKIIKNEERSVYSS